MITRLLSMILDFLAGYLANRPSSSLFNIPMQMVKKSLRTFLLGLSLIQLSMMGAFLFLFEISRQLQTNEYVIYNSSLQFSSVLMLMAGVTAFFVFHYQLKSDSTLLSLTEQENKQKSEFLSQMIVLFKSILDDRIHNQEYVEARRRYEHDFDKSFHQHKKESTHQP